MLISSVGLARNALSQAYPLVESLKSIQPIADEQWLGLDPGDETEAIADALKALPQLNIVNRRWDMSQRQGGQLLAQETNALLPYCRAPWTVYLQADEVLHEDDLPVLRTACERWQNEPQVEALLFSYLHFWGDYAHYLPFHGWYSHEIRALKTVVAARSVGDAQSFRHPSGRRLRVARIPVRVFHYGWVRPPHVMQSKRQSFDRLYSTVDTRLEHQPLVFDYGPLGRLPQYAGTHPAVMQSRIQALDWQVKLNYGTRQLSPLLRPLFKHERMKYRMLSWVERHLLGGRGLFAYSNWEVVAEY